MRINRVKFVAEAAKLELRNYEIARKANVSLSTISAIRGGKSVSKDTAEKVAIVLNLPVEQLLEQKAIEDIRNE